VLGSARNNIGQTEANLYTQSQVLTPNSPQTKGMCTSARSDLGVPDRSQGPIVRRSRRTSSPPSHPQAPARKQHFKIPHE